ncbi:uncharacterized protein BJ212DRAFT_400815 [Suillus subaureus]|uniref:Uncharacterized protein n=1 Tax=Suillus subaureus TaxID=48587 RepID=A0A9P7E846_9AGAM|nr:uncharacterized protein BJ212DRAFT_400815 [Suillus subaureus]KAG1813607.1 hypothetical protein BJ212DRAFT_400815 [Suillus subaureus]
MGTCLISTFSSPQPIPFAIVSLVCLIASEISKLYPLVCTMPRMVFWQYMLINVHCLFVVGTYHTNYDTPRAWELHTGGKGLGRSSRRKVAPYLLIVRTCKILT